LPNEQAQGLQRSGFGQQPDLQPLPQQTINAGYDQYGQPIYQDGPRYGATPAGYVPNQPQLPRRQQVSQRKRASNHRGSHSGVSNDM